MAKEYLTKEFTEKDARAALILDNYLEACNQTVKLETAASHERLLAWTTLYHERGRLESSHFGGESVNWLRAVCYVLDQRRLQGAERKAVKKKYQAARKRNRPEGGNINDDGSNAAGQHHDCDNGPNSDCSTAAPFKRLRLAAPLASSNVLPVILQSSMCEQSINEEILKGSTKLSCREGIAELHKDGISGSDAAGRDERQITAAELTSHDANNEQLRTESTAPLQLNLLFYWISKAAEIIRSSCHQMQPSTMTNTDLTNACRFSIDHMEGLGVFADLQGGLNHSTEALQKLLASISTICSRNPRISSTATSSIDSSAIRPVASLSSSFERLLQLQSDHVDFLDLPTVRQSTGEWNNPKFAEWLKSPHASSIINNRLRSSEPLPGYQPSGSHQINGDVLFVLGVVSMMLDLFEEYWARVRGVVTVIRLSKSSDFFQNVKLLSNLPALKSCCNSDGVNIEQLYNEVNKLLRNNKLPRDLDAASCPALEGFSTAYHDWEEMRQKNEQKRKAAEEEEKVKREAEKRKVLERKQHRRDVVEFLKEGFRLQETFIEKNPFWVLGIDPLSATEELLRKAKKKLALLLHPDKCSDPSGQTEATQIFLGFSNSVDEAQRLLSEGRRNYITANFPTRAVAPYAELLGLPTSSSSSSSTSQAQPAAASTTTARDNKFDHQKPPDATAATDNSTESVSAFRPSEFADFILANSKTLNINSNPSVRVQVGQAQFSRQRLDFVATAPPKSVIRLFVFRPTLDPNFHIKFNINSQTVLEHMKLCSAIFQSKFSVFDLAHVKDLEPYIQPVYESVRERSFLSLGVQTVDTVKGEVSEFHWIKLIPKRFIMPSQKPRIIGMLQSFCNAPDEYQVKSILQSQLEITFDVFPTVAQFSGCYVSELKEALEALLQRAAAVEMARVK